VHLPEKIAATVEHLSRIPGIGKRTALRYALFLTRRSRDDLHALADSIRGLQEIKKCQKCNLLSDDNMCSICRDPQRLELGIICVVEDIVDCLAIERSGQYRGHYHILGGVLNPLMGIGPQELTIDKLVERIKEENIHTVILAINPSVEGDATCSYIKQVLPDGINIDRIGFGMPMGGHLEHLDALTISKALENRKRM
jgi:recombination protein RecR